jgi:acyl-CoA reductase-like NAD-dependent aldehyde dehydrogenase
MSDARLLIGGERAAGTGAALKVENPYTEGTIAALGGASEEQVDAALAAARRSASRRS